jgi:hypothetical protein
VNVTTVEDDEEEATALASGHQSKNGGSQLAIWLPGSQAASGLPPARL